MTKEAYNSGRIRYFQQDGNREFISLLACVCADGNVLPPALIYQGSSGDLQNTWMEDLQEEDKAYFTSTANGWTSDRLGLAWLRLFDKQTKHKGSRRRLLIVDGHSSHINWGIIQLADALRILILILPPHTTHRLQPLDVGLFSPLSQAYSTRLTAYTHGGLGWVTMTKRMFWPLFKGAWEASFTEKNVKKAFEKTGIWPLCPEKTVKSLEKSAPSPLTPLRTSSAAIATPLTCRGIRRFLKQPNELNKVIILEKAVMKLATHLELQKHENDGLRRAVIGEKKRRQRNKRLNLIGQEATAEAQFFSPTRVIAAREFQETKEAAEQEEKRQKALQKEEARRQRVQALADKQEAAIQRQMRMELVREARKAEKAEKAAEREAKRVEREAAKESKKEAAAERKKQLEQRRDDRAAAAAVAAEAKAEKRLSKATLAGRKKAPIPRRNVLFQPLTAAKRTPAVKPSNSSAAPTRVTVAAEPAGGHSRSGRALFLPQRYHD